eukprot:CAMPEP_0197637594 /NCGR_PEP_ID=MMETSP1338-20131121/12772_1 /TAXON_ID=43686 ORGANISM="Pelagodinium beii, Strain RCC1491" /NCGR_SAMPLE_ID=MMETSP1338 /ASSEMBLY_ACC=CAM_ASM_000754 /LENGTH=197 /DNA_ID=CAMNT_0043210033 /DNA_START=765 /DNA_END=1360 /DNA_ORIENTATION=-
MPLLQRLMERSAGKVTAKALSPRSSTAALVKVSSSFCASQSASRSFDQEVKPRSKEIVSTAGQWRDATTAWAAPKTSPARRLRKWCSLILGASWFPASEVIGKQQSWAAAAGEAASQCSTSGAARNGGTALPKAAPAQRKQSAAVEAPAGTCSAAAHGTQALPEAQQFVCSAPPLSSVLGPQEYPAQSRPTSVRQAS